MSKFYVRNFPRPVGIEPTIYTKFPEPLIACNYDNWAPSIEEYDTIEKAIMRIITFNCSDDYLKNLKINWTEND